MRLKTAMLGQAFEYNTDDEMVIQHWKGNSEIPIEASPPKIDQLIGRWFQEPQHF